MLLKKKNRFMTEVYFAYHKFHPVRWTFGDKHAPTPPEASGAPGSAARPRAAPSPARPPTCFCLSRLTSRRKPDKWDHMLQTALGLVYFLPHNGGVCPCSPPSGAPTRASASLQRVNGAGCFQVFAAQTEAAAILGVRDSMKTHVSVH